MAIPEVYGTIEDKKADVKVVMYRDRNDELYIEITDRSGEPLYVDVNDRSVTADVNGSGGAWDHKINAERSDAW